MNNEREIRLNQTVAPFGVGALLDFSGQSFVAADITEWKFKFNPVPHSSRFAHQLGVEHLRLAPIATDQQANSRVPYIRFPRALFCPKCRLMDFWNIGKERSLEIGEAPHCKSKDCGPRSKLSPMRFVQICSNGHLQDVDWSWLAHSGTQSGCKHSGDNRKIYFNQLPEGVGYETLQIKCGNCKSHNNVETLMRKAMTNQLDCNCQQPWFRPDQRDNSEDCEIAVVQRGASNVYFPSVATFLDVPPHSNYDSENLGTELLQNPDFVNLLKRPNHPLKDGLIAEITLVENLSAEEVLEAIQAQLGNDAPVLEEDFSQEDVFREEWKAFTNEPERVPHIKDRFIAEHTDLSSLTNSGDQNLEILLKKISHLVKVKRIREVRALQGFRRYKMKQLISADQRIPRSQLPAIEAYGEGIFLAFKDSLLTEWEKSNKVHERVRILEEQRLKSFFAESTPERSARWIMLHTLSHLLTIELTYQSGYGSSSIRERLYAGATDDPLRMSGLFLYTSEGDSQGTLGGLVRLGEPEFFIPVLISALRKSDWCSLDPVCKESRGQGTDGLSLAACHACVLTPETSCSHFNILLDRNLLIDPEYGFFKDLMNR